MAACQTSPPLLAVTMGDAAGAGPELCLRLLARPVTGAVPIVIGNLALLARVARETGIPLNAPAFKELPPQWCAPAVLDLPDALDAAAVKPAHNQALCGAAAARFIEQAVRGALGGTFAGVVTAPISKRSLHLAGIDFPGHTEMLAQLTGAASFAMLFYSPQIACVFATCHQSLGTVSQTLTSARVVEVATLASKALAALDAPVNARPPALALLGVNPHAGEEGLFGDEEERILLPALKILRAQGLEVDGPMPADAAFTPASRARYRGFICMYHDQGAIPFKMLAFDTGVNVTLGLPIVRTSPDHGTAFDIAWRGQARPDSLFSAFDLAARLAAKRV